ncbi:MAG: hypothetical protein FJ304_06170 [Planctomycetes bacterium]|nr:hypothetical protein [Planctomycetota bacterium]
MRARALALIGFALVVSGADGQDFKQHSSAEGRYKAQFPGEVKTETNDITIGKDKLKLVLESVELKGDTVFMVSYIDATEAGAKTPAATRLDKVRDGNKGDAGKVVSEKDITVGAERFPGRDIVIEMPSHFIRNRVVIVGPRLYQVMVQGTKEVVTSASADRFLNSFEITK